VKLFVMRHGPAEDRADSGMDADRALTSSGRERVRSVAKLLADEDEKPLRILTSHLVRAVQTAEIVALVTKQGTVETRREIAPGGEPLGLIKQLAATEGTKRVMLVGHEPDLSDLLSSLLGSFDYPFDKAMVVGLRVTTSEARLRFVLDPRALCFDPDRRRAE
jgi:phosphohistidine phosphatase